MKSFYQQWLEENNKQKQRAIQLLKQHKEKKKKIPENQDVQNINVDIGDDNEDSGQQSNIDNNVTVQELEIRNEPVRSCQTDLTYEENGLKLIVQKGMFQRQKNFALQDHLFF